MSVVRSDAIIVTKNEIIVLNLPYLKYSDSEREITRVLGKGNASRRDGTLLEEDSSEDIPDTKNQSEELKDLLF